MSQMIFRVFLSSTFGDFQAERERLRSEVWPRLREFCAARGASFHVIDLRWGISPRAATSYETLDVCLEEIHRCQRRSPRPKPNFILLLGDRYGWRPPANRIPDDEFQQIAGSLPREDAGFLRSRYKRDENAVPPEWCLVPRPGQTGDSRDGSPEEARLVTILRQSSEKLRLPAARYHYSATHQEILEGVFRPDGPKDHILAVFRNLSGLPDFVRDGPVRRFADYLEDGRRDSEAVHLLDDLRSRVAQALPAERRIEIGAAWSENATVSEPYLDEVCRRVEGFLRERVEAERTVAGEPSDREIEGESQSAFMRERGESLIGRELELERILEYLTHSEGNLPLIVRGAGGSGKSALLAKVAAISDGTVGFRFIGASPHSGAVRGLLEDLIPEIAARLGLPVPPIPEDGGLKGLAGTLWGLFDSAEDPGPHGLILDAIDQLVDAGPSEYADVLPRSLPPGLRLVISVASGPESDRLTALYPEAPTLDLPPLSAPDCASMLDSSLAGRTLTPDQRASLVRTAAAGGRPLWIALAAPTARRLRSWDPPPALPGDVTDLASFALSELARRHGPVITDRALRYIRLSRFGLSESEIQDVLWADPEVRGEFEATRNKDQPEVDCLPPVLWSRLYEDLEPYLSEHWMDGQLLYRYFHRIVGEAAGRMDDEERRMLHGRLADWFGAQPLYTGEKPNGRRLMEEIYHLTRAGRVEAARTRLTDFSYAIAKCALNRSEDWVEDFRCILGDRPGTGYARWADFAKASAHILRRGNAEWPAHKILLQLAFEHADDSPVTAAAETWLEAGNCDWPWLRRTRRPARAGSEACIVLEGHAGEVSGAFERPDGSILSWSWDEIRIWNPEGKSLKTIPLPDRNLRSVHPLKDGRFLSWTLDPWLALDGTGDRDRTSPPHEPSGFFLWDSEGDLQAKLEGHGGRVEGALECPDGFLVSWSEDRTMRRWDPNGYSLGTLVGLTNSPVRKAVVRSDGAILFWGQEALSLELLDLKPREVVSPKDHSAYLLDPASREVRRLRGHGGPVRGGCFLRDGSILTWSEDAILRSWSPDGAFVRSLAGHRGSVLGALVRPCGSITSWSEDGALILWSSEGEVLKSLDHRGERIGGALCREDGSIVSWTAKGVYLWDTQGEPERILEKHTDNILGAALREDGSFFSWSHDTTVRLWSRNGEAVRVFRGHSKDIQGAVVLSGGNILTWSNDQHLRIWNPGAEPTASLAGHARWVTGVRIRSDGSFVTKSDDGTLRIWDPEGAPLRILEGHSSNVTGFVEGPEGRILSWSFDLTLRLWDRYGEALAEFKGHTSIISGAAFMPGGAILSWSEDGTLRLWDPKGHPIRVLTGHIRPVQHALARPDGSILSWATDDSIRLWTPAGELVAAVSALEDQELPDGTFLMASPDGTVRGRCMDGNLIGPVPLDEAFDVFPSYQYLGDDIELVLVRQDGSFISAVRDEHIRLWSPSCEPAGTIDREKARVTIPEFAEYERTSTNSECSGELGPQISLNPADAPADTRGIRWHSPSICNYFRAFPDGRCIVTRLDGQVCVLRTYRGNLHMS